MDNREEPLFVISIAAKIVGVHAQTLRYYERVGLLSPSRSRGNLRLYSPKDIERLRRIKGLMEDLGVNLAGVEVILRLAEHIAQMESRLHAKEEEINQLRGMRKEPDEAGEIY